MTTTFASGKTFRLTRKLNPADTTMYGNLSVWVTTGRIFLQNDNQKEWISFTGNSLVGTEYVYTGLTRWLSQTADPATGGTGLTWLANQQGVLVAMHDQIVDKSQGITPQTFTTVQRDALTASNGAFIYNSTAGLPQIYYGGAWYDFNTAWSATPNASPTVAGKVEIATTAQSIAGTDTGETGATLTVVPSDIAKNVQSAAFVYLWAATDTGTDVYTASAIPDLTAYTTGQFFVVAFNETNTTVSPTLNIDGIGAIAIKDKNGSALVAWDIGTTPVIVVKAASSFNILSEVPATADRKGIAEMATDAEVTTGTDETRYTNPKQMKSSKNNIIGIPNTASYSPGTNYLAATSGFVNAYSTRAGVSTTSWYVGAANPATTLVASASESTWVAAGICFPVKSWYYWRVDVAGNSSFTSTIFTPTE